MCNITVTLIGEFADLTGHSQVKYNMEKPVKLIGLLKKLEADFPRLEKMLFSKTDDGKCIILPYVICNVRGKQAELSTNPEQILRSGEEIKIVMPVQGG